MMESEPEAHLEPYIKGHGRCSFRYYTIFRVFKINGRNILLRGTSISMEDKRRWYRKR